MRYLEILRNSPSVWLTPLVVLFALVVAEPGPSPSGAAAAMTSFLILLCPLVALGAAVESWRFRGILHLPRKRGILTALLPRWVVGIGACVASLVLLVLLRAPISVEWTGPVVVSCLAIVAWCLIGALSGFLLPAVVAWPLCIMGPLVLFTRAAAIPDNRWRHLTAVWFGCCSSNEVIAPSLLTAVAVFWGTICLVAIASLIVLDCRRRTVQVLVGASAAAAIWASTTYALSAAAPFGYAPTVARSSPRVCAQQPSGVRVCVWPEDAAILRDFTATDRAVRSWHSLGVKVPEVFDEGALEVSGTITPVQFDTRYPEYAVSSLATGIAKRSDCQGGVRTPEGELLPDGVDHSQQIKDWLVAQVGAPTIDSSGLGQAPGNQREIPSDPSQAVALINEWLTACRP